MSMVQTFKKALPSKINTESEIFRVWIGDEDFVPELTVDESSDYNCGAVCNELEFVRYVSEYHVKSFDIDEAADKNLDAVVQAMIDLPRNNVGEEDAVYRNRFRFIVNQKTNPRRTTTHAINDALSYFLVGGGVEVVELFDTRSHYFQLRLEGVNSYEGSVFLNSTIQGFIDQNFIGGPGVGEVISYVGDLVDRIRAVGVDFDVLFIARDRVNLSGDCVIGTVQKYLNCAASIRAIRTITLNCDARVV